MHSDTFIPLTSSRESSPSQISSYDSNDVYGARETNRLKLMVENGLMTVDQIVEGNTLRNSLALEFGGLPHYDKDHIVAGLTDALGQKGMREFRKNWVPNVKRQISQRALILETPKRKSKFPILNSPGDSDYLADRETSPEEGNRSHSVLNKPSLAPQLPLEELLPKGLPKYAEALNMSIRFCVFNTGNILKPEFWDIIKQRLTPEIMAGVVRLENVTQPNGHKRIDMWVKTKVASKLKSAMYLTAPARREGVSIDHKFPLRNLQDVWNPNKRTKHWRIDVYRNWRDRELVPKAPKQKRLELPRKALATFNVNGIWQKKSELSVFLQRQSIGILALQETLIDQNNYSLRLTGYDVYERSKTKTFRGQALAIHSSLSSYEIDNDRDESYIHVKVMGLTEGAPWHIISVYLPSGGNNRSAKTNCLNKVLALHNSIVTKNPNERVVIMGDFNIRRDRLRKLIRTEKSGLEVVKISGNGMTFHRKSTTWSDIDSIIASQTALPCLRSAKAIHRWSIDPRKDSDHFPLVSLIRAKTDIAVEAPPIKYRFNVNLVKGHGATIVHNNRWASLPIDPITDVEDLNSTTSQFVSTINTIRLELGIKEPVQGRTFTLDRKLKRKVKAVALARKKWLASSREGSKEANNLFTRWQEMKVATKRAIQLKEQQIEAKRATQVAEWFRDGEMRAFHRWESKNTVRGAQSTKRVTPVKDKNDVLLTNPKDILNRTTEYFKELAQDDKEKLSQNKNFWKGKAEDRKEADLPCNDPISWRATLLAVRSMILGTTPGDEDVPIEIYKSLLKEECHTYLKLRGIPVGDCTYIALPEDNLPLAPCTPMGVQLYRIINGMWDKAAQPECWQKATTIPLFKSGDPTDLQNYRGISLIAVGMKIFTVILAMRISNLAEMNDLLVKEQGGFRTGEEAIAQFVALAEIVRRRRIHNLKTWTIFIDFKKAFDKVMHEALFEKLDAMGFRGHFLEVIKAVYSSSKAQVKVGGVCGTAYDMLRGTRQGCPLSPVLFLIFINDILKHAPKGVVIPGLKKDPATCAGLLFADDVVGLTETKEEVVAFLDEVTNWSQKWHLPTGASKCGVMLIGGTEEEQKELKNESFYLNNERVEVVRSYKYLGIIITDSLGDRNYTDETAHCKTLATKVRKAVDIRRPFLRDKSFPLQTKIAVINSKIISVGCYGGEWVGMCQLRTSIIQKEINKALKIVLNSSTRSTLHATMPTSLELGVPTMEQKMSEMRVRLWQKAPKMKTWLGHLANPENRFESRIKVWTTGTQQLLKRLLPYDPGMFKGGDDPVGIPRERLHLDHRVKSLLARNQKYDYLGEEYEKSNTDIERQKQEANVAVIVRAIYKDMFPAKGNRSVKSTIDYISYGFERTRDFLKSAVYTPNLTEGTMWLVRLRTNAWWTTKRKSDMQRSRGQVIINENECPCCKMKFRNEPEFCHILLDCNKWKWARDNTIKPLIDYLYRITSENARLDLGSRRLEIAVLLLGATIDKEDQLPIHKLNDNLDSIDNTPDPLTAFTCAWGGNGEIHLPGLNAHSFTLVAKFLALVMPRHKATLFPPEETEGKSLLRAVYETTTWEESPVKNSKLPKGMENGLESDIEYLNYDSGSPSPNYPPGRLSKALQTEAMSGMGTRCMHAKDLRDLSKVYSKKFAEVCQESDEESLLKGEGTCVDRCYPRLVLIQEQS